MKDLHLTPIQQEKWNAVIKAMQDFKSEGGAIVMDLTMAQIIPLNGCDVRDFSNAETDGYCKVEIDRSETFTTAWEWYSSDGDLCAHF